MIRPALLGDVGIDPLEEHIRAGHGLPRYRRELAAVPDHVRSAPRSIDAMPPTVSRMCLASCPAGITPPLQTLHRQSHARAECRVAHLRRRLSYHGPNDLDRALSLGLACRNRA
jgi:hypothetical protein